MRLDPSSTTTAVSAASWQALDALLDELGQAAGSITDAKTYYRLLLERIVPAVEAWGGAVWSCKRPGTAQIDCQVLPTSGSSAERLADRASLAERRTAVLAGIVADDAQSPELMLEVAIESQIRQVLRPFTTSNSQLVIELLIPANVSSASIQRCRGVLDAMAELISDFHRQSELRGLQGASRQWRQYDDFAQRVHASLDLGQTALTLANEASRIVECDRVSILTLRGKSARALATSGVDQLNGRSTAIRALEQLATRVAACGEPVWYHDGVADLPDEILAPLDAYLEQSQARVVAVVPLRRPVATNEGLSSSSSSPVIGVIVAEHFHGLSSAEPLRERLTVIANHASIALNNAQTHSRMPLARVSRGLAKIGWLAEPQQLPKTAAFSTAIAAAIAALVFIPAHFEVEAKGELQPVERREVFASDDGVVNELLTAADRPVAAGQPLVVLRKPQLELESQRVLGELQTAEKKLASVRAERLQDTPAAGDDRRRDAHALAAEEEELKATIAGLQSQQSILDRQRESLTIRSPLAGRTLTWNLDQLLAARPVQRGQALLTVANVDGPWQLELHVPDDRVGYLLEAQQDERSDLDVTFSLVSDPGKQYHGRLTDVALTTELDANDLSSVRANVTFDRQAVPALRPGATAIAKIHCGRRSLGFVWLGDLYNYLRSLWW